MNIQTLPEAYKRFRKKIESFSPLPDEDFLKIADKLNEKQYKKGEVLLREGSICRGYYFIISGSIRSFSLEKGRELNLKFYFEDDIVSNIASYRNQEPSDCYLVAMEDTVVFSITRSDIELLYQEIGLPLYKLAQKFFAGLYIKEEKHSNIFKLMSPGERYNFVLNYEPQYVQRTPLVHLASYLGTSRKTLGRIRSK